MQADHIKLVKDKNGRIFTIFNKEGTIYIKQYADDFSSPQRKISSDALSDFSVFLNDNGLNIALKKTNGDIYLCRNTNNKWEEKHLFKASPVNSTKLYIYTNKDRLNMIYNYFSATDGTTYLNCTGFSNRKWQPPVSLEIIYPFHSSPFSVISLSSAHIIVIFRTKDVPLMIKEIHLDPLRAGNSIPIVTGKTIVTDFSFVAEKDILHMVYITKSRFGNRLTYKNKNPDGLTNGIVLWENRNINSCVLYKSESRLWVLSAVGTNIFITFSDDNGKSFCPVYRHKYQAKYPLLKAEIISDLPCGCSEVYVSAYPPYEIAILKDIDNNFMPEKNPIQSYERNAELSDEINILKNKTELYEKQISEANKKIGELSFLLSKRNEELSLINSKWLKKVENIRSTYEPEKLLPAIWAQNPPPEEPSQ